MTKLEQIARAIYYADPPRWPSDTGGPEGDTIDWSEEDEKSDYLALARAAVKAMREPTEAMRAAGGKEHYDSQYETAEDHAELVWNAMIDAILNEKTE